eukprot:7072406-Heterocapsa_arctica.AAC.1
MIAARDLAEVQKALQRHLKTKWGSTIEGNWGKYLGRWLRRRNVDGNDGFDVRIPPDYIRSLLSLAGLERCKPVLTPFMDKVYRADTKRILDAEERALYRSIVGKLIWMIGDRPDI